jgi:hypothetical protein
MDGCGLDEFHRTPVAADHSGFEVADGESLPGNVAAGTSTAQRGRSWFAETLWFPIHYKGRLTTDVVGRY